VSDFLDVCVKLGGIIFACGALYSELRAVRKDIARLERKVEKHNNFDRRIVRLETLLEENKK
jgi:hypothetical protein